MRSRGVRKESADTAHEIACEAVTLDAVRRLPPISSGFTTERVFRLHRHGEDAQVTWWLDEERLASPLRKMYDSGRLEEWIGSYEESVDLTRLQFIAARVEGSTLGLATWYHLTWNNTIWLLDIRTREASRRAGVGSALMRCVQAIARERRVRGVAVETQTNNYPALRFYRKHGFVVTGFNDHLYTNEDTDEGEVALFLFWEMR